jgi:syntaxin-binding protein 5
MIYQPECPGICSYWMRYHALNGSNPGRTLRNIRGGRRILVRPCSIPPSNRYLHPCSANKGTQSGQVYVFGQAAVQVHFSLPTPNTGIKFLHLHGPHLAVIDSRYNLTTYSLSGTGAERTALHTVRGQVACIESDLSLDWLFLGLTDGSVDIWDIDRECVAKFTIPNLYRGRSQGPGVKTRILPTVAMALHPKDIGMLLVGYSYGAALFSFKENRAVKYFELEIPAFAKGGDTDPSVMSRSRRPRLTHLAWHPSGTYVLTCHEDGCIAFWDAKNEAAPLHVRTVDETFVNIPRGSYQTKTEETMTIREPIVQAAWCSATDPEDTSILISGGQQSNLAQKGLTYFDFGPTTGNLLAEHLSNHVSSPRKQRILPTFSQALSFTVIPRTSPFYNGTHEPLAVLALLETGEIASYSLPDCQPLPVAQTLPPAITFVSPPITQFSIAVVPQQRWQSFIGRSKSRNRHILLGGAPARRHLRRFDVRNVMISAHADGVVRLWDASHGEVEASDAFEIDVAGVIHAFNPHPVDVISMSMAGMTGELVVGTYGGEVAIWRHGRRDRDDIDEMGDLNLDNKPKVLQSTRHLHFDVFEGFLPLCMVNPQRGAPAVVKMSEVGFVAIGYDTGNIGVVDLRGPAVIFLEDLSNIQTEKEKKEKRRTQPGTEVATVMEFAIMKLDGAEYSSLVLLTGTSTGRLVSHALLPTPAGGYALHLDTSISFATDGAVVSLLPINVRDGNSAVATPNALAGLRDGQITDAATVIVQERAIRVLGGVTNKLEKCEIKDRKLVQGQIVTRDTGIAVAVVSNNRRITAWSLPDLQRIAEITIPNHVVEERLHETVITPDGDIFCWTDKMECSLFTIWGRGLQMSDIPSDALYDPLKTVPPRPTISNLQWIMGTQYISPQDFNVLSNSHPSISNDSRWSRSTSFQSPSSPTICTRSSTRSR